MKARIHFFLSFALLATLALAAPSRFLEKCGVPLTHSNCGKTFECNLSKGHAGSHAPKVHDCTRETRCNSCSVTRRCTQNCGHNSYHTRPAPHDCKRPARCTRYGCSFTESCAYGNCGHGTHFVGGHRCLRRVDCPTCPKYVQCKKYCGHDGTHVVEGHRCGVEGKCIMCNTVLRCITTNCGHGVMHTSYCHFCRDVKPLKVD